VTGSTGPAAERRLVLLLNNPFVSDSRSWKLARSLAAVGWSVTVVARRAAGLPDREQRDGFAVVRLDQPRPLGWLPVPRLPEAATGEPTDVRRSRAAGLRAALIATIGRPVQAVRYLRLAGQWADRIAGAVPGAEVWQSEGLITLPVALALRRRLGGRVVYDARDLHVESARFARLPGPWRRLLTCRERSWARSADAVITANEPYAEVLERTLGVRATVVFNGPLAPGPGDGTPSGSPILIRDRLGLGPSTRIVLCLGNVAPGRGVEQLCRAIAGVAEAALVVVGPGGQFRDRLAAEAASLPAADRIHFLPEVPPSDIPRWTAAADVAAMPIQPTTLNHRLTTPTRLFDALGAGIPVVASDLPGMAAIVRETDCGVLCDPTDPGSIAAALRAVLDAPAERRLAFRAAALAAARGPYAWDRQVEKVTEVYRGLASA
jgi:glycosyltransferase involved in cell wall biosynthesis